MKLKRLRHSTIQIIIMVVMILLLPVLAWMQYQWLDQLSQWEQERIQESLHANTTRFSEDFDRDLSFLYRSFWVQIIPDMNLKDALWDKYARWRRQTGYPELLKNIHVYLPDGDQLSGLYKFLRGSKTFLQENWPNQLEHIHGKISSRPENKIIRGVFWNEGVAPAIVAPVSKLKNQEDSIVLEQQHGWVILELDMNALRKNILPSMVEKYYAQGEMAEFDIQIRPVEGEGIIYSNNPELGPIAEEMADANSSFFSILYRDLQMESTLQAAARPQNEGLYQNYPMPVGEGYSGVLSQFDLFQRSLFLEELDVYAGDINYGQPTNDLGGFWDRPVTEPVTNGEKATGLWKVTAVHKSGSIDSAIASVRYRNVAIAVGILMILGASGVVLVFSARRARRLAKQQMEFVAGVSHELRTPLTIIRAAGDNLADSVIRDTGQLQQYGRLIENQGRRLSDMVEKILLYSRIQSGHQQYKFDTVDICDVVNQSLNDAQRLVEKYGTAIESNIEDTIPPVLGDKAALQSVIINLLANALKYGRSEKPVEISVFTRKDGGDQSMVFVRVRDHGRGIPASEQIDIFKPFFRGEFVRSEQLEGSGLGLSLVKQIVEAHQGKISVESKISQGTTFIFTIPISNNAEDLNEKDTVS